MANLLRLLGRHARWALPIGVLIGIALPALASLMRPLLTPAVVATLAITLVRLDWQVIWDRIRRPALPLLIAALQLVASPLIVLALTSTFGLAAAVSVALILQSAAPPVGSAATFALMTGIDGEHVLVVTVLTTILLPFTLTPLVAYVLAQSGVQVDLLSFFLRVCALVGAPLLVAQIVRWLVGVKRLRDNDDVLSGVNVVLLVVFAIAIMDGVAAFFLASPAAGLRLVALSFLMAVLLHLCAYLALRWHGHETGLVAALGSGNRNMGLMLAITAGSAGETASLYFGIAQIPMYCVPLLLAPLVGGNRPRR
jgi:BASS family bile acid:Na+ symporter